MAKQIKSFSMSGMTVGSCNNFHYNVNALIDKATPAALHLEEKAPGYKSASEKLASIVNRKMTFVATKSLRKHDDVRDSAGGVIGQVINAYETSPVEEKQAAAMLLASKIANYRRIRDHEYTKQTSEVDGFLRELDAEAEAVATLGLTEEVEALRSANAAFNEEYLEKAAEAREMDAQSDIKTEDMMDETNALYKEIVQIVNAYAIVQPSDEINQFIDDVNGLVAAYSKITGRGTTDDSALTEEPEEPTTDPEDPTTGEGEEGGSETTDPSEGEEEEGTGAIPHP